MLRVFKFNNKFKKERDNCDAKNLAYVKRYRILNIVIVAFFLKTTIKFKHS